MEKILAKLRSHGLKLLKDIFLEERGADAGPLEVLLKSSLSGEWLAFTILYPKVAFFIDKIVDVIRDVDKLFVHEYELKLYGGENSASYMDINGIGYWKKQGCLFTRRWTWQHSVERHHLRVQVTCQKGGGRVSDGQS